MLATTERRDRYEIPHRLVYGGPRTMGEFIADLESADMDPVVVREHVDTLRSTGLVEKRQRPCKDGGRCAYYRSMVLAEKLLCEGIVAGMRAEQEFEDAYSSV